MACGTAAPVPLKPTVDWPKEWLTTKLAARLPSTVGVKPIVMRQFVFGARVPPTGLQAPFPVAENSLGTVLVTPLTVSEAVPVLVSVTCCVVAEVPRIVDENASDPGDKLACALPTPVPLKATTDAPREWLMVRLAERRPTAEGVKPKVTVQLAAAASEPPAAQAPAPEKAKSAGLAPLKARLLTASAAVPVLLSVTDCPLDATPRLLAAKPTEAVEILAIGAPTTGPVTVGFPI